MAGQAASSTEVRWRPRSWGAGGWGLYERASQQRLRCACCMRREGFPRYDEPVGCGPLLCADSAVSVREAGGGGGSLTAVILGANGCAYCRCFVSVCFSAAGLSLTRRTLQRQATGSLMAPAAVRSVLNAFIWRLRVSVFPSHNRVLLLTLGVRRRPHRRREGTPRPCRSRRLERQLRNVRRGQLFCGPLWLLARR
jgi:hypothetical protein